MLKKLIKTHLKNRQNKIIFFDENNSLNGKEFAALVKKYINILKKHNNKKLGVAIKIGRNVDFFAIIYATWLSDGFYLPISDNISKKNIKYQIKESKINFLFYKKSGKICYKKIKSKLKNKKHLCYKIYTSGSTGDKKGVEISKNNFCNYVKNVKSSIQKKFYSKSILITGDISFDIVNADIAFALAYNTSIGITHDQKNIFSIINFIKEKKIESIYAVPTLWEKIILICKNLHLKFNFVKNINSGGEIFKLRQYKSLKKIFPMANFINFYGPTEFTINATFCFINKQNIKYLIDSHNNFSIGKPLNNVKVKIIKNSRKNNWGELALSGNQLMLGYSNSDNKNVKKIENQKYYLTGDLVYRNKRGNLFFKSRNKDYIKFKGNRINLETIGHEIQEVIKKVAIVLKIKNELVCFTENIIEQNIKQKIISRLDVFELPTQYKVIKKFPILKNGKLDKNKLKKINGKV